MIISTAITSSGFIHSAVKHIKKVSVYSSIEIMVFSIICAILSAFMNSLGALALMLPIAIRSSIEQNRSPGIILIPLAFSSVLGGMMTVIGSPVNLLISHYREQATGDPYGMFDYTAVGGSIALIGIVFIATIGWKLIPCAAKPKKTDEFFELSEFMTELSVPKKSPFVGMSIIEMMKKADCTITIIGVIRDNYKIFNFSYQRKLQANDILLIEASHDELEKVIGIGKLELNPEKHLTSDDLASDEMRLIEAVVPPNSRPEGKSAKRMRLRSRSGINLIAISRRGQSFKQDLNDIKFKAGDVVLLQGDAESVQDTVGAIGFLPLAERGLTMGTNQSDFLLIGIFATAIILAATSILPVDIAFATAIAGLILAKILPSSLLTRDLDPKILIALAAMLPLGDAIKTSGAADIITADFMYLTHGLSPHFIIAAIMVTAIILSNFMNNVATAVIMAPIGIQIATDLHLNVDTILMTIMVGASCSFLTPIANQSSLMVMGPGNYKFSDYLPIGIPMEIITVLVGVPAILYFWPL